LRKSGEGHPAAALLRSHDEIDIAIEQLEMEGANVRQTGKKV